MALQQKIRAKAEATGMCYVFLNTLPAKLSARILMKPFVATTLYHGTLWAWSHVGREFLCVQKMHSNPSPTMKETTFGRIKALWEIGCY
jgi:hypothetical protein